MTYELEQLGYKKQVCQKCGNTFWSIRERATCGDAPCDEYEFIGNPVTDKQYDLMGIQKKFKGFFKDSWSYSNKQVSCFSKKMEK